MKIIKQLCTLLLCVMLASSGFLVNNNVAYAKVSSSEQSIENYLEKHYGTLKTNIKTIKLDFVVEKNEKVQNPYDYAIYTSFYYDKIEDILDSIKYTDKQKLEFSNKFKSRQKSIAKALIKLFPKKKFYGCYNLDYYKYPNIYEGYVRIRYNSWINYELKNGSDDPFDYDLAGYRDTKLSKFKWYIDWQDEEEDDQELYTVD